MQREAPTHLRLNGLRAPPEDTFQRLVEKGFRLTRGPLPASARVDESPFSAGATLEYLQGRYFLQDLSSQFAPQALAATSTMRVADLCAAPGGKTVAIADHMQNRGAIAAFEIDAARHRSLVSNLARCGVLNTATWAKPAQAAEGLPDAFDAVLLDAPCTGEGVAARDPGRRLGQLQEYAECAKVQSSLIETAWKILRPGGILLYATCTLAPEENELQVQQAVSTGRFRVEKLPSAVLDARPGGHPLFPGLTRVAGQDLDPSIRDTMHLMPNLHGCLGFYLARLRKEAS